MSLLQNLPYKIYKKALSLSAQECERLAILANLQMTFTEGKPGERLVKALDRTGCTYDRYVQLIDSLNDDIIPTFYRPQAKLAIMIANERYTHLANLATPVADCELIARILTTLGFMVVTVKNSTGEKLSNVLQSIFEMVPEDSYWFIFYAGHGCQTSNTQCMLGVDCPTEDIQLQHCVTDILILSEIEKRKPELVVLIMDMCRVSLDWTANRKICAAIPTIEQYTVLKNLKNFIISYSAQSTQSAYEMLQIECTSSTELNNEVTYELQTRDMDRIVPGSSLYASVLCERLGEGVDVSTILDKVHADVENSVKKQRPIKVEYGMEKRCLYDPPIGNTEALSNTIKQYLHTQIGEICYTFAMP